MNQSELGRARAVRHVRATLATPLPLIRHQRVTNLKAHSLKGKYRDAHLLQHMMAKKILNLRKVPNGIPSPRLVISDYFLATGEIEEPWAVRQNRGDAQNSRTNKSLETQDRYLCCVRLQKKLKTY